jgi:hypothetical protein
MKGESMAKKGKKNLGKYLSSSFVEEVEASDIDTLSDQIIKSEQTIRSVLSDKKADERLNAAKQVVKDLNSAYNDAMNVEKAKIQHMLKKIDAINGTELGDLSVEVSVH